MPRKTSICRLLGIMHGDGNMSYSRVHITDKCLDYHIKIIHPLFNELFGVKMNLFHDKNRNSYYSHTKKKDVYKFLTEKLKLPEGSVRKNLKVEEFMNKWNDNEKAFYIAGIFDSEGYVSKRQAEISITITSKEIFDFISNHLHKLNFTHSKRMRNRRMKTEYELRMYGKKNISSFFNRIPIKNPDKIHRLIKFLGH